MYNLKFGDSLILMNEIPDKSIDMILCDLPYNVTQNKNDISLPFDILWKHYKRIIKNNGVIALFGQGLFYVDLVNSNRKMFRYDIIWDKELTTGFLNANRMPLRSHEQIAIFYKKLPTYSPQFKDGKPLHSKGHQYKNKIGKNSNYGKYDITDDNRAGETKKYPKSIWKFRKPHPSITKHPTEKSIELLKELIKTYTKKGEIVLDNCMGSGTTGIACIETSRNFLGIDIDKQYFDVSEKRLKETETEYLKKSIDLINGTT